MTVNIALFDDLDSVAEDAAGALDRDAQASLFSRLAWFRLIHDHCPPRGRLAVLRGREGERQAWLFLAAEGRNAQAYAAWYSLRFDAQGDVESDVMTASPSGAQERHAARAGACADPGAKRALRKAG